MKMRLIWLVAVLCNLEELSRVAMGETVLQVLGRLLADRMPRSYVPRCGECSRGLVLRD